MSALNLLGVIEGFYGRPWTVEQRLRLFDRMQRWGMNTYLYAPKDDRWHRQQWREAYPAEEAQVIAALAAEAEKSGIRFVYALAPGLNLNWEDAADREALAGKFRQVAALGVRHFSLLFDDIPYAADRAAQAQVQMDATHHVMDALWPQGQQGLMLFCPTEYCAERARPSVSESPYLNALGQGLRPEVEIFWTGPQVVSLDISVQGLQELNAVLGRKALIWDNLHASDYTLRRLHLGPYAGRPLELREHLAGILSNPNNPLEPNTPGLFSLADYARAGADWTPEASLERALTGWLPEFNHVPAHPVSLDDLRLLADALYLPGGLGPRARRALETAQALAAGIADQEAAITELRATRRTLLNILHALEGGPNRDLLFDLHPFIVDMIEELHRIVVQAREKGHPNAEVFKDRGSLADQLMNISVK